ncbi:hypothetical protein [Paraoerskovia marina]|uniref:hypothetical protein n=1 Tax=Paraoerskovia marina TaxID=545619 RepID=UPI0012DEC626|nr:hypothetical protein [Paraoerskovia marina]
MAESWFASNVEKLVRSGFDVLHLGFSLHHVAVRESLLVILMRATGISPVSNLNAWPLSDLWLFAPFAPVLVHWTKVDG